MLNFQPEERTDFSLKEWEEESQDYQRKMKDLRDSRKKRTTFDVGEKVWYIKTIEDILGNTVTRYIPSTITRKCIEIFWQYYIIQDSDGRKYKVDHYALKKVKEFEKNEETT